LAARSGRLIAGDPRLWRYFPDHKISAPKYKHLKKTHKPQSRTPQGALSSLLHSPDLFPYLPSRPNTLLYLAYHCDPLLPPRDTTPVPIETMARPRSYSTTSSNSTFSVNTLSSLPSDSRPTSAPHHRGYATGSTANNEQELALGSMYDYLVKFILIGPSGCGKYFPSHPVLPVDSPLAIFDTVLCGYYGCCFGTLVRECLFCYSRIKG